MEEPALHDRPVPHQLVVLPHQRVHPAEAVLPVVLGHVLPEDVIEQAAPSGERRGVEVGGVLCDHPAHPNIL
jgi:hypothetical protein